MKTVTLKEHQNAHTFAVEEAFKAIRTNLLFGGSEIKSIMLTSCQPNEGKSTITLELGISLSEIDKRVLIVDADLRKSTMLYRYASDLNGEATGLSQYLSGQSTLQEVLYHTQYEKVDVIFAGPFPPNPAELVSRPTFKELLDSLRDEYDYILIDTPPVGVVIDAAIIAPICDAALIVIAKNDIKGKFARMCKEQLEKSGCKILGVILNELHQKRSAKHGRSYKGYAYAAQYGYGHSGKERKKPEEKTGQKPAEKTEK